MATTRRQKPATSAPKEDDSKGAPQETQRGQEVATRSQGSEAALPDFMKGHTGRGTEALGAADVEIPRLKLMQANSPELEEFNELKPGDLFHTSAEENFGREVRITPLYVDVRYILWRPREDGGGILARADDGIHWNPANTEFKVKLDKKDGGAEVVWRTADTVTRSRLDQWGTQNPKDADSPPAATKMYNLVAIFPDHPDIAPAVITLQRASIGVARKFLGKLKTTSAPSYGTIFKLSPFKDSNSSGQEFWNYQFNRDGTIADKDQFEEYFKLYEVFAQQGINIRDIGSLQDEAANLGGNVVDGEPVGAGAGRGKF